MVIEIKFSLVSIIMILGLISVIFIPFSAMAFTTWVDVDYDDLSYQDWTRSDVTKFTVAEHAGGYAGYCSFSDSNAYVYKTMTPGANYEVYFDFKFTSVDTRFDLFRMNSAHGSAAYSVAVWITSAGVLWIDGTNTGISPTTNTWHSLMLNVTSTTTVRYSYDHGSLSNAINGGYTNQGLAEYGSILATNGGTFWFDNYTIANKVGYAPEAHFTVSPTTGDGLTTFNFTDNSSLNSAFGWSWYWDFGDGNHTHDQNPSHIFLREGNYTVNLTMSNLIGSDYYTQVIYVNKSATMGYGTPTGIISGDGEITDDMFGFIIVILLITGLNLIGTKTGYLMISVFAVLGMVFAIPMIWVNDSLNVALVVITVLGNISLLVYGFTRE